TVVEIVPEVAAAAGAHFGAWNAALLRRPDVQLVVDDGRRWLASTTERYDVVVSDLFIPWHAGAGSLYAREMFETVARRLSPGGVFCQWLPLYQLTHEEFDAIARTFLVVFPEVSLWRNDFYPDRPVVGLVGRLAPGALDLGRVDEGSAALHEGEVRQLVPEVVALGERASSVATLADARRTLGALRTEQERVARELEAMERRLGELAGPRGDDP